MLEKQTLKGQLLFFNPQKDVQNKRQPQKKLKQNSFSRCQSKNKKTHQKHKKTHSDFYLGFLLKFKAVLEIGVRKKVQKKVESDRLEIDFFEA